MTDCVKKCSKCKTQKACQDFYSRGGSRPGLQSWCKDCTHARAYDAEYQAMYRERTKLARSIKDKARYNWTAEKSEQARAARRMLVYRLSPEAFALMLTAQGGLCAVCFTSDFGQHGPHVDHDHACCPGDRSCGQCVRGILCGNCNRALGILKDDPSLLYSAAEYLLRTTRREAMTPEPIEETEEPVDESCCNQGCCSSDN